MNPLTNDRRYSVNSEWCGYDKPRYVARFCGEWIGQSISYSAAVLMCVGHKSVRNGAEIITEKSA